MVPQIFSSEKLIEIIPPLNAILSIWRSCNVPGELHVPRTPQELHTRGRSNVDNTSKSVCVVVEKEKKREKREKEKKRENKRKQEKTRE